MGKRRRRKGGGDRGGFTRRSRRAQSHRYAMATADDLQAGREIPDHPMIPTGAPELVTDDDALAKVVEQVRTLGAFAYDTEFIGELSYHPRLCVVQIATPERVVLIDPFEAVDLTPVWELIADPAIETIVHAGPQDLEPVVRHLDRAPANIMDTQVAAGFIGLPYPLGLSKIVRETLGVAIGKGLTFTNWDHRPLSDVHLQYAADDVRFLPALQAFFKEKLDGLGRLEWAREECARLCEVGTYRFDADQQCERVKGAGGLKAGQYTILRELVKLRDQAAREHDVPPRSLIKDEVLVTLTRVPIRTVADLGQVAGLPRPVRQAYGETIVRAIEEARALPNAPRPRPSAKEESATERSRIDSLVAVVRAWCHSRDLDGKLTGSRSDVADLFRAVRSGRIERAGRLLEGWRKAFIGDMLVALMRGDRSLTFHWTREGLRTDGERTTASD